MGEKLRNIQGFSYLKVEVNMIKYLLQILSLIAMYKYCREWSMIKMLLGKFATFLSKEITYHKFIEEDVILQMIEVFNVDSEFIEYPNNNLEAITIVLNFYKNYNPEYYKIIVKDIDEKKIIISDKVESYVDTKTGIAYIKINHNDSDVFSLVHELAHYIDRNCKIIPDKYWILAEAFAFYMEKQLEKQLEISNEYDNVIRIRRNNRIYMEKKMLQIVNDELYYENLYKQLNRIELQDIDEKSVMRILKVGENNLINYLVQYPIANIVSSWLINFYPNVNEKNFCELSFECNLREFLNNYVSLCFIRNKKTKFVKNMLENS